MNDGKLSRTLAQKARVAMIGASSTSPSIAIARSGSSGHEPLQSIEGRGRRQRWTQVLAVPLLKEDEVDADDPRRHFHATSG
jgi:hypothetical protein